MYFCASYLQKKVSPKIKTMAKEENMDEVERKSKMIQITGRVSQSVKDEFYELQESGGYETFCLFMEALLERYKNPIKVNKDNVSKIAELQRKVSDLEEQLSIRDNEIKEYISLGDSKGHEFEELRAEHNQALARIEQLECEKSSLAETANEYDTLKTSIEGCINVPVDEMDLKCLKYLAERENRIRKRNDITPAVFFQFAIREIFIKGNKFSIDSVPDSVISKFEKEIKNGQ